MKRLYDHRWKKARADYLSANPLCVMHLAIGQTVAATVVDHIKPHKGDEDLFWDETNWQSLCKQCHDAHKQRMERGGREPGCDTSGLPIDPGHHWKDPTRK